MKQKGQIQAGICRRGSARRNSSHRDQPAATAEIARGIWLSSTRSSSLMLLRECVCVTAKRPQRHKRPERPNSRVAKQPGPSARPTQTRRRRRSVVRTDGAGARLPPRSSARSSAAPTANSPDPHVRKETLLAPKKPAASGAPNSPSPIGSEREQPSREYNQTRPMVVVLGPRDVPGPAWLI